MPTSVRSSQHPVLIGNDSLVAFTEWYISKPFSQLLVLVDESTREHCWPHLQAAISEANPQVICIPTGEQHKTIDTCLHIWEEMRRLEADRKTLLLNLGGGVIGDIGGFCASTFKRGMSFVQMPTTLLAQVDASVGGKLGVDFQGIKNGIGLFKDPEAVFIAPIFLESLPEAQLRSGYAEMLKHGLIADAAYWEELREGWETIDWTAAIERSVEIKAQIVAKDPEEQGLRKSLNYGHSIGHVIESLSWESERPLFHGEAIAWGMLAEAFLSKLLLGLPEKQYQEIARHIRHLYGAWEAKDMNKEAFFALLQQDKKNEWGKLRFSLLPAIGMVEVNVEVKPQTAWLALQSSL